MNPKDDDEDKICPHCRKTFSSHSARNKHLQKNVCIKSGSRTPGSTRKSQPPDLPPAILLKEDKEGLLMGHTCSYSKYKLFPRSLSALNILNVRYRICQLLNLTNTKVYPLLSHCTIPGGINVCPTTDTDKVRLEVLLAAKKHGVNQISVPKTGSSRDLLLFDECLIRTKSRNMSLKLTLSANKKVSVKKNLSYITFIFIFKPKPTILLKHHLIHSSSIIWWKDPRRLWLSEAQQAP